MLLVASPLLILMFFLCVLSLLVWLVCVLACFSLGLSCMGFFLPIGLDYLLFQIGEISTIISSKIFSYPFFFSSSSGTPIILMLVHLILSQRSLRQFFSFFLLYSALQILFSPFYLPAHWFVLLPQIFCYWFLVFLISVIVLFLCLFFNSSRSLLIDSCIFSILLSRFCSSLLSLFWIFFFW